jgi:hypothetical protein
MGSRGRCESGQNGYVNSYRILKTKERKEKRRERNGQRPSDYVHVESCATHFLQSVPIAL